MNGNPNYSELNVAQGDLTTIFGDAGFDTASVEPQGDFPIIPPGKYLCLIERACVKQTKAQTGHYIEVELTVQGDEFKNRKLWDRINIQNPSTVCQEIGLRCAAALGQAAGIPALIDSAQLVNQFVIAHVKVKNDQNEVRTYSTPEAVADQPQPAPTPYVPPQQVQPKEQYRDPSQLPPAAAHVAPIPHQQPHEAAPVSTKPPWAK